MFSIKMMPEVVNVSNDVDLPTFLPRFIRERVDWNVILTVSNQDLIFLGIREAC